MGNNLVCKDGKHDWDTRIMRLNGKQEEYNVCKNCGTTEHVDSNESCKNHIYGTASLKKYSKDKIYEIEYRQCTKCSDTVVINTKQIKCYGNNHIGKFETQSKTENCKKYVWLECKSCNKHIGEINFPYHKRIGIMVGSDEKCNQYKYAFCRDCQEQIGTKTFTKKKSHQRSEIKYETIDCMKYSYRDCTRCGEHEIFGRKPVEVDHERIGNTYAYSGCTQYKVQKCNKCGTITKWLNKTGKYEHLGWKDDSTESTYTTNNGAQYKTTKTWEKCTRCGERRVKHNSIKTEFIKCIKHLGWKYDSTESTYTTNDGAQYKTTKTWEKCTRCGERRVKHNSIKTEFIKCINHKYEAIEDIHRYIQKDDRMYYYSREKCTRCGATKEARIWYRYYDFKTGKYIYKEWI